MTNRLQKAITSLLAACLIAALLAACGASPGPSEPEPPPPVENLYVPLAQVTEFDLQELLSQGLPVILNFGDDSPASLDTLAALEQINKNYGGSILICAVDLALKPDAREGFPVQVIPSQFFFNEEGLPITLPLGIGIILSTFISVDTEEPVFTIHEGAVSKDDLVNILSFMNVTPAK
ncbi:MAG: hypothetical protein FWG28_05555 [Clostridiales bacterium]|nr:hypothetical protein [Clostridiales bacterium]